MSASFQWMRRSSCAGPSWPMPGCSSPGGIILRSLPRSAALPAFFLASHAHKMGSLSRVLEYDVHRQFNAFPDDSEIAEIVSTARKYLDQGETLRARIRQVAKLRSDEATAAASLSETAHEWLTTLNHGIFEKRTELDEIVVVGGGGHAKVVISILRKLESYRILGYTDRQG